MSLPVQRLVGRHPKLQSLGAQALECMHLYHTVHIDSIIILFTNTFTLTSTQYTLPVYRTERLTFGDKIVLAPASGTGVTPPITSLHKQQTGINVGVTVGPSYADPTAPSPARAAALG